LGKKTKGLIELAIARRKNGSSAAAPIFSYLSVIPNIRHQQPEN
jgi:hypothetical protein